MAATSRAVQAPLQFSAEHGSQIFVYTHLRTRQTIYSLTKAKTKDALEQLTFVGKKSVPTTFRKDMWTPLCVLNFPNRFQGLHAYARLREFRERHETEWPIEEFTVQKGPQYGQLMSRRERSFKLMDQKANSIADMAAVLSMQARPPDPALVERMARQVFTKTWSFPKRLKGGKTVEIEVVRPHWARAKRGQNSKIGHRVFEFEGNIEGTGVWWADPNDAEYAESWPVEVVHDTLGVNRGYPVWPPPTVSRAAATRTTASRPVSEGILSKVTDKFLGGGNRTKEPASSEQDVPQEAAPRSIEQKIEDARRRARENLAATSQRVTVDAITRSEPMAEQRSTL